ncbi:MAG TPA: hypothetical protein VK747_21055, partial [Blastocatellia bacterium]|nr:hypothetical protein [Blastocatellia bacterium]
MSLPQPQLDDKKFDALVAESTRLIPRHAPEWTDHNSHDPGITLVELFAWLAEMQQYYLNGIGSESYLKFLKLLGTKPLGAAPARTEINFGIPESTLAEGINAHTTLLAVAAGDSARFPMAPFNATLWNKTDFASPSDDPNAEDVRVTAISADTFTVLRGQANTTAAAHNAAGARYGIIASTSSKAVSIPRGTKLTNGSLQADGQMIFETGSSLLVLPIKLKRILTSTRRGLKDNTEANHWDGLSYFAFGEEAEADSHLYVGFDQAFPAGEAIALTFDLVQDYAVAKGRHDAEETLPLPPALVTWEYYNAKEKWVPLEIIGTIDEILRQLGQDQAASPAVRFGSLDALLASIEGSPTFSNLSDIAKTFLRQAIAEASSVQDVRSLLSDPQFLLAKGDGTLMLSQSGRLFFNAPGDMRQNKGHTFNEELLFWLRATVRQPGFELPPQVEAISINTIDAFQTNTASEVISYSSHGKPNQSFQARGYLAIYATSIVQVQERDGRWKDWEAKTNLDSSGPNDLHYVIEKDTEAGIVTVTFGDGKNGRIPNQGQDHVRLISYLPDFEEERKLGGSNGLPSQSFAVERTNAMAETLMIQVQERVVLPEIVIETTTVSCLLDFARTTTVKFGQPVEIVLSLRAKGDLCGVTVEEDLAGELSLIAGDLPSGKVTLEAGQEQRVIFEVERLSPGLTRTLTYRVNAGANGGSITGQIVIATGVNCPTVEAKSPSSIVEVRKSQADERWRDWIRVDDFDASGPSDPHFVFDTDSCVVTFGDGINGDTPQSGAGESNIRVVSLQTCNGENGNIASKTIGKFAEPFSIVLPADLRSLQFSQVIAAASGKASETLEDAQVRAREDLRTHYQAVTSADFEFVAVNTPGLRVSRAKAIPGFSFSNKADPQASVTVVVLPYSLSAKPVPSENFLRTVCRHLDRHRLITTQV